MVAPALALGLTAASTGLGAMQAFNANQTNRDISLLNYYEQQAARADARAEADRQRREAQLGQTDAYGNRTYFVPGRGWVTELSDQQQTLQDLTEREQQRQLTTEADRNARISDDAAKRRDREDVLASAAEDEYRRVERGSADDLRQLLIARGAETRNRAADRAGDAAARQSIRGGGTNVGAVVQGARAASDAASARQAGVDAALQARGMVEDEFDHDRDRATKLYDYFRRSSTTGATPVSGVQTTGPQKQSTAMSDQATLNILAGAPQLDYQSPDYSISDAIGGMGNALGSYYMDKQNKQMNDAIINRWGTNAGGAL